MYSFMWFAVGLLCGAALGYDEIQKKLKKRMRNLYGKNFRFVDEQGHEVPYQKIMKLLLPKK